MQIIASDNQDSPVQSRPGPRVQACEAPVELSAIYEPDVNMAVWKRRLDPALDQALARLASSPVFSQISAVVSVDSVSELLQARLPEGPGKQALVDDAVYLVDLFSCLFDLPNVGFRLARLDRQMCPRFHVDSVPCRLITTYTGIATEWLPGEAVHREKLGLGSNGLPDHISGVYRHATDIQRLQAGDVALLKGEKWLGNEGMGLVHRSPDPGPAHSRIMMTLDFA